MNILETRDLKRYYGSGNTLVRALDGVSFSVEKGEMTAIVGASGSGKSTLLNLIGALDTPTSGEIIIQDRLLSKLSRKELSVFRRRFIGFVFQSYNLLPVLNGYDNITLPSTFERGRRRITLSWRRLWKPCTLRIRRARCPLRCPAGSSSASP